MRGEGVPAGAGAPRLLAFLTTTCQRCQPFWEMIAAAPPGRELGVKLVVVTPSPSMEDERKARELTPPEAQLVMDSDIWFSYGVGQGGTAVLVRPAGGGEPPWQAGGEVLGEACPEDPWTLDGLVKTWLDRAK